MFFRTVLNEDLGCASYVLGDAGEMAVVDPKWEIEEYLDIAAQQGLRITRILESHNHADHLSGHGRLVAVTGATIYISEQADVQFEHVPLRDGDTSEFGGVCIRVLATPGHRPEHLTFLVEDRSRSNDPWVLLSGDSLFVGDLARPDLAIEAEQGAGELYHSLKRLTELDDFVELRPGHIGGSLCGGAGMSKKPDSTIGYEKRHNPYLQIDNEERFVRTLVGESSTPQPPNFEMVVELNRGPLLTFATPIEPLLPERVKVLVEHGALVVDTRDQREFDAAHIPGSVNVTANQNGIGTRAAWATEPDTDVVVVGDGDESSARVIRLLEAVGFRNPRGYLAGGIGAWKSAGHDYATTPALDVPGLARRLNYETGVLVDVRDDQEWLAGHVEGSIHVPYQSLRDGVPDELRNVDQPLLVACSAGIRSALAASLLKRAGIENVEHVADGGVEMLEDEGINLVQKD